MTSLLLPRHQPLAHMGSRTHVAILHSAADFMAVPTKRNKRVDHQSCNVHLVHVCAVALDLESRGFSSWMLA